MNAAGRRLSESRVRENLMHGLRRQAMETGNTAPLPDPTTRGVVADEPHSDSQGLHREVQARRRDSEIVA